MISSRSPNAWFSGAHAPATLRRALLVALWGACRSSAPPAPHDAGVLLATPSLADEVAIHDLTPPDERPPGFDLQRTTIARDLHDALAGSGLFAHASAPDARAPAAAVSIDFAFTHVEAEGKAVARVIARARVKIAPSDAAERRWADDVQAAAEAPIDPSLLVPHARAQTHARHGARDDTPVQGSAALGTAYTRLAARLGRDLVDQYVERQRLHTASPADVMRALEGDRGELQDEAFRVVAERHLGDAAPTLLRLLSDDDERTRDGALGALVALGDRRAVSELAKTRSLRDRREMRKILDAIAVLGGDEAVDYLRFVADAHDDPEMKALAQNALERLLRRQGAGGAAGH